MAARWAWRRPIALAFPLNLGKLPPLKNPFKQLAQPPFLLAALAGVLLTLAFPKASVAGLAWFAPGLLLFAGMGQPRARVLWIGWFGGVVHYLTSLYWLCYMPVMFVPFLAWTSLSGYCAIYTALWLWLSWKLFPVRLEPRGGFRGMAAEFAKAGWHQRMRWAFSCAILWVALEIVLGRFLTGFPWLFLGMSQYKMIPLIQISSVTGVYGVSFLVVWFSVSLFCAGMALVERPRVRWAAMAELALAFLIVGIVSAWGLARSMQKSVATESMDVALIQPSVPQTMIWDPKENAARFKDLMALTEEAMKESPQLLVWPESAAPGMLRYNEPLANAVADLAQKYKVWIIMGSDDAEPRANGAKEDDEYYNACFLISPEGRVTERYLKRRLVIFGEYVPLVQWLPFLKKLTPIEGGFTPGTKAVPYYMPGLGKTAVLICFEDVFPHVAREYVTPDTDFLVNITNDGWFGESAEQWQHAADGVFRAVENGVPLIRATNNGVTCWIDEKGRMHVYKFGDEASVYRRGYAVAKVPKLAPGWKRELTYYTKYGDRFGWACAGAAALLVLMAWRRAKRESHGG